ncbi:accessory Sec system protein Asp2 [Leuconostoc palmae]|uniref:accessory Sec system protein Asp2 n=1 Tax=Leuconostoc palmae TaxID=501487 RepID=UPI001C7CF9A6|nr:accessory Sec system protein Asp2 [Leuconostoc palmae]
MRKIKVLNIGAIDLFDKQINRHDVAFRFISVNDTELIKDKDTQEIYFDKPVGKKVILPDYILLSHLDFQLDKSFEILDTILNQTVKNYIILYDSLTVTNSIIVERLKQYEVIGIAVKDSASFIEYLLKFFFTGQEGSKLSVDNTVSHSENSESVLVNGHVSVDFQLTDTQNFRQLHSWRYNYVFQKNKIIEIWLEYESDDFIEVMLYLSRISQDGQNIKQVIEIKGKELQNPYVLSDFDAGDFLFCSVCAKGVGKLKIGQLHIRRSRGEFGTFFVKGKRIVDHKKQEIMTYFNPGDRKPPLNVYFSGYRSAEGFEGNFMMQDLGAPYLLITDPRIEGGGFYLGNEQLENGIIQSIKDTLSSLNFAENELILSGLSMGTFGALYYAADLKPHAVVVGKPLVNIGNVALNEHTIRPGGFPTSLDVLYNTEGGNDKDAAEKLNERFWTKFKNTDFRNTKFSVAYMKNDDYDLTALNDIRNLFKNDETMVLSKGFVGRHNDNSYAINMWFIKQYKNILKNDFRRKD